MGSGSNLGSTSLVRFEVATAAGWVAVFLSQASCMAAAGAAATPQTLAHFVSQHRPELDRIVEAKLHAGARSPVVLMARDLEAFAGRRDVP